MTRNQKSILTILSIVACGLISLVSWLGYQTYLTLWQAPILGPAIDMPTSEWALPATWTPPSSGLTSVINPTTTLAPTNTPVKNFSCGGPPSMIVLGIGSDSRSDSYLYGLGDVIRIIRIDFIHTKVTVLEFPRDLWVEIPGLTEHLNGQSHEKLNQAYLYGNPGYGYYDGPGEGPGLMARTLALNFGVTPERYIAVNMRTFEKIIDAVGGVKVDLPKGLDGRTSSDRSKRLIFPQGPQTLDGEQALTLARIRSNGLNRAENQNLVMCALQEKLTSPGIISRIPALIKSFQGAVQTDLTPEQVTQLGCIGTRLKGEDITFVSFPQELFKGTRVFDPVFDGRVFIWEVDYAVLRDYVARFNAGTWPTPVLGIQPKTDEGQSTSCP